MIKNLLLLFLASICFCFSSYAQPSPRKFKVVTTQISRGAFGFGGEYIQMLVNGKNTCSESNGGDSIADLRRVVIYDPNLLPFYVSRTNDSTPGIGSGMYRFPNRPFWDSISFGTEFLIYNDQNKNSYIPRNMYDDSTGKLNPSANGLRVIPVSWLEKITTSLLSNDTLLAKNVLIASDSLYLTADSSLLPTSIDSLLALSNDTVEYSYPGLNKYVAAKDSSNFSAYLLNPLSITDTIPQLSNWVGIDGGTKFPIKALGNEWPATSIISSIPTWFTQLLTTATHSFSLKLTVNPKAIITVDSKTKLSDTTFYCPSNIHFNASVGGISPSNAHLVWSYNGTIDSVDGLPSDTALTFVKFIHLNDVISLTGTTNLKCITGGIHADTVVIPPYVNFNFYPDAPVIRVLTTTDSLAMPIIDSLGRDSLGNLDTTVSYKTFKKGDTTRFVARPNTLQPSDTYSWIKRYIDSNNDTTYSPVLSTDTLYTDTIQKSETLLFVHFTNIHCVSNPYDTTVIHVTALDTVYTPHISITGLPGLSGDSSVCSALKDTFAVAFNYQKDTLFGIKGADGNDSVYIPKDTSTRYKFQCYVYNPNSSPSVFLLNDSTQVYKNGDAVSFADSTLKDGDSIRVFIYTLKTQSWPYDSVYTLSDSSNSKVLKVGPSFSPVFKTIISATQTNLCPDSILNQINAKDSILFTITADTTNAGYKPVYQWFKNDTLIDSSQHSNYIITYKRDTVAGLDTITFQNYGLAGNFKFTNGDTLSIKLTNTTNRCLIVDTVVAVNPLTNYTTLPFPIASVYQSCPIYAFDTMPRLSPIQFSIGSASDTGTHPVYNWYVNGQDSTLLTTVPQQYNYSRLVNGDTINMKVTSSIVCAQPRTFTTVNPIAVLPNDTVYFTTTRDTACFGTPVTVTPTIINGGGNPSFEWFKNGQPIFPQDNGNLTYTITNLNDGDSVKCVLHSNRQCYVSQNSDTSNYIYFHINPLPVISAVIASSGSVCDNNSFIYFADTTLASSTGSCAWSLDNPTPTSTQNAYAKLNLQGTDSCRIMGILYSNTDSIPLYYSITDSNGCVNSQSAKFVVAYSDVPTLVGANGTNSNNYICSTDAGKNTMAVNYSAVFINPPTINTWYSGNPAIATVDQTGLVTALKQGNVTIYDSIVNDCGTTLRSINLVVGSPLLAPIKGVHSLCNIGDTITFSNDSIVDGVINTSNAWLSYNPNIALLTTIGPNQNTALVQAITNGIDTITYSLTNTCGTTTQNYLLTVGKPIVGITTGQNVICKGYSTNLYNDAVVGGGSWSSSDPKIATIDANGRVSGIDSGSVNIIYTMTNSCGDSSALFSMTVQNALPIQQIVGDTILCKGQIETFTHPISGGKWISSDTSIALIDSVLGTVTGIKDGLDTIKYVIQNTCGIDTIQLQLIVGPPIVGTYTFKNPMCVNDTIILTNNTRGATGFQWIISDPTVARLLNVNTDTLYGVHYGKTSIFYNPTNTCSQFNFHETSLTVLDTPHIAAVQGVQHLCLNSSLQFSESTKGGFWSSADSTIAFISNSGIVDGSAVGNTNIRYKVTDNNGCSNVIVSPLRIDTLPILPSITGNDTACFGRTTALVNAYNNNGQWKGIWTSNDTSKAQVDSLLGIVSGKKVGQTKISYTVTDGNGCYKSVDTAIYVNPIPAVATITGNDSVCINSAIKLADNTLNGVWYSDASNIATIDSVKGVVTGVFSGTANISYKVTVLGCDSTTVHPINVNINNVAEISGVSNMCLYANTLLKNPTQGGTGIIWSSDSTTIAKIAGANGLDSVLINGTGVGTDTIRYSVNNNCGTTVKAFAITIGAPKVLPIVGVDSICVGNQTTYSNPTQINLGDTAVWFSDIKSIASVDSVTGLINGKLAGVGTIRYKITSLGGCYDTVAKAITVVALPTVASIIGNSILCIESSEQLQDITPNGIWKVSNNNISIDPSLGKVSGMIQGRDSVYYQVTNAFGCINTNGPFVIDVKPLPVIASIKYDSLKVHVGLTLNLSDDTLGGIWISKDPNYLVINDQSVGIVTGGQTIGTDTVFYRVTDTNGCADSVYVTIQVLNELNDVYIPNYLAPAAKNEANKTFSVYGKYATSLELKIFNQWGEVVYSSNSITDNKWDGKFKGEYQQSGVYVYVAKIGLITGETIVKKGSVNLIR